MKEVVVHVHPLDHEAVREYYAARGAVARCVADYSQRWLSEPEPEPFDRYAELDR